MSVDGAALRVIVAEGEEALGQVRDLFRSYAAEFADSIAEQLCFQGFDAELAALPGRYAPPHGALLLALDGVRPAGCVAMRDLGEGSCEMKRLFVVPEYRGRRVGRLLVSEVLERAGRGGYRRMLLDTLPEMTGAIGLYRSFGFVEAEPYWQSPVERTMYFEKRLDDPGLGASRSPP